MLKKIKNIKFSSSILIIIILILLLMCSWVLFISINNYMNIRIEQQSFYYYFSTDKINFDADITINSDNVIKSVKNENITLNSSPIYYLNSNNQMILPSNMEIIYPYKKDPMYKIGSFSKIDYINNYIYINSETGSGRLYDCFLYDGKDLYVFIEDTTVMVDKQIYKLSPLSFIEVTREYVRIYNKIEDKYIYLDNYIGNVEAYTEEYFINLSNDSVTYNTKYYMLIKNVDRLNFAKF